jgi:SNF2 family DNA or RNA helicase
MQALSAATERLLKPLTVKANNNAPYCRGNEIDSRDRLSIEYHTSKTGKSVFRAALYSRHVLSVINGTQRIERRYPISFRAVNFIRNRLPEYTEIQHHNDGMVTLYEVPVSDYTCEIIKHAWPASNLVFGDEHTQMIFDEVLLKSAAEDRCARNIATFKDPNNPGLLPCATLGFEYHPKFPLSDYQKLALLNSYISPGYALFMEQGTGKTAVVVARVCNDARNAKYTADRMYRALIVCPKNVRQNWLTEFAKFSTLHGKATVLTGNPIERIKQLTEAFSSDSQDTRYSVVICSYDLLGRYFQKKQAEKKEVKFPNPFQAIHWDLIVADESHYAKTPNAQRTHALHCLREKANKRMILTGTPITNSFFDLWAQWEILDEQASGFSTYKKFKEFYGVFKPDQQGNKRLDSYQNIPLLKERLAKKSFIITKKEALPYLPEKSYDIISVEMTPEQQNVYDRVSHELLVEVENELSSDSNPNQMAINNILIKMLRLAQITSGFAVYDAINDDEGNELRPQVIDRFDPDNKLEQLVEILKSKQPGEKTIVWSCWIQNIKTIQSRLELEKIKSVTFYGATSDKKRKEAEQLFNCEPETKIFIGNPAAGGTGLNLLGYDHSQDYSTTSPPTSCNHVIYYSQNWSAVHRAQSEDRAHRRGTKTSVQYTDLCVFRSIDEEIRKKVLEKRVHAYQIADIREVLKSILNEKIFN